MLYIVLAYLMLFAALTNSVCLNNASFFFLFKYFLCQGYELSGEIALKNNHYYYYYYAAGKINKMDNKLLYDHLICHSIDYFHVSIVDMIHIGNNTESQLDELLSRKERKWIWDLCSITPYGLNQDDGYCCQSKSC